jgi:hypothetical protein
MNRLDFEWESEESDSDCSADLSTPVFSPQPEPETNHAKETPVAEAQVRQSYYCIIFL